MAIGLSLMRAEKPVNVDGATQPADSRATNPFLLGPASYSIRIYREQPGHNILIPRICVWKVKK